MTIVTPAMLGAAWKAWRSRHADRIGPGPGFREAVEAAFEVYETPLTVRLQEVSDAYEHCAKRATKANVRADNAERTIALYRVRAEGAEQRHADLLRSYGEICDRNRELAARTAAAELELNLAHAHLDGADVPRERDGKPRTLAGRVFDLHWRLTGLNQEKEESR